MMKIFGAKAPSGIPKTQKRSVFGLLFNPRLGDSIRPMGQAFSGFVTMIAMVFAMNGLFPKNHPALKGEPNAPTLSLPYILQTAWSGLSFTRAGLPKVLLFFAVATALVLSVLSIITALMLGFVGHAHAAGGVFTAQNPTTDLAQNWIDFLFSPTDSAQAGNNISNILSQTTNGTAIMPSTAVQSALWTALGIYSGAILIIAGFILLYHLVAMVAETAHSGTPMGKNANQIWAPIRLVVAIGLLVPIAGGTLNSGQYIVIFLAEAGSGMASNLWNGFVTTLAAQTTMPTITASPDIGSEVYDLTMSYACEYAYNFQIIAGQVQNAPLTSEYINGWGWDLNKTPIAPPNPDSNNKYSFTNQLENGYDLCGSYTIPTEPTPSNPALQSTFDSIYKAVQNAFNKANASAATESIKIQAFMSSEITGFNNTLAPNTKNIPTMKDINGIEKNYEDAINSAVQANTSFTSILATLTQNSTAEGWISAGAWFNSLSSAQAEINEIVSESLPATVPPDLSADDGDVIDHMGKQEVSRNRYVRATANESEDAYTRAAKDLDHFSQAIGYGPPAPQAAAAAPVTDSSISISPIRIVLNLVEIYAWFFDVWHDSTTNANGTHNGLALGVQFSGNDPLLEMAQFGHNNIGAGMGLMNAGIFVSGLSAGVKIIKAFTSIFGKFSPMWAGIINAAGMAATAIAALLFFFGVMFFTIGVVLAFVVPLLPFMHFFFNTITWITCVAEAIIAIPLVALAHLSPSGEGLPGQNAKGAYYMIFSVLLRPVLMVFGLICGLLIMYMAVGLLNALYAFAVAGAGDPGSHMVISRIMFTVVYVMMIYSVAQHAFGLISRLPNYAMEWMGGKSLQGEKMGEPSHINQGIGLATGYLGSKAADQMQQIGQNTGKVAEEYRVGHDTQEKEQGDEAEKLGYKNEPLPSHLNNARNQPRYIMGRARREREDLQNDANKVIVEGRSPPTLTGGD